MDNLAKAMEILKQNLEPEYPIFILHDGVVYRVDAESAEPVETYQC